MCGAKENYFEINYKEFNNSGVKTVEVSDGRIELLFNLPEDEHSYKYMYRLWDSGKDDEPDYSQHEKSVYMERDGFYLKLKIALPHAATYKFHLFVRRSDLDGTPEEDKLFLCCAQIELLCKQGLCKWRPYPCTPRQEWGPGQDAEKLGLTPVTHPHGTVVCESGQAEIEFRSENPVQLVVELRSDKQPKEELMSCVLHREEKNQAVIYLKVLKRGYYALDIYGKQKGGKRVSSTYPYICSYLIDVVNPSADKILFPDIANQRCGMTDETDRVGLKPLSHTDSFFKTTKGNLQLEFQISQPSHFLTEMHHLKETGLDLIQDHIFITMDKELVTFNARFPHSGTYLISLYGKPRSSDGTCACLYHYVIQVSRGMKYCRPYPKAFSNWGEGCSVSGLEDGLVPCGEVLPVEVNIPEAKHVAVIGDEWSYLCQYDDDSKWEGNVKTGAAGGELKLSACYQEDSKYFVPLLEFKVRNRQELEFLENVDTVVIKLSKDKVQKNEDRQKKREQDIAKVKHDLQEAMGTRNLLMLQEVIRYIDHKRYKHLMKELYTSAKDVLRSLERIARLSESLTEMSPPTMQEVRSYQSPKCLVHKALVATFLLLREDEEVTKDWKHCQSLCNSIDLNQRIQNFHLDRVHPEIAARAYELLKKYTLDDAKATSLGTAAFYSWVMGIVEELNLLKKGVVHNISPASIKRQKSIFSCPE